MQGEGNKLFLKGIKCYTEKCCYKRRAYALDSHGQQVAKVSEYSIRLRKNRKPEGRTVCQNGQFAHIFENRSMEGVTGEKLLELLERRLDNVLYRLGFASSRAQARQVVTHGHIIVNSRKLISLHSSKEGRSYQDKGKLCSQK